MWGEFCNTYSPNEESNDIEFTGETEPIKSEAVIEDGQIRIWNYKSGKVKYFNVDEKTIVKVLEFLQGMER